MYVAVKGGERAILNSYQMLDSYRRGDTSVPNSRSPRSASRCRWPWPA